ncbi:MAG: ribonuclease III [Chlamydiae bacterium]|nr:ribonuclease III [Chlamydiota bacterium]
MNALQKLIDNSSEIESKLGYTFKNKSLLALAFVHRSFYNEHRQELDDHNERLEFLGDSILGLVVAEYLYSHLPKESEGQLSHFKAHLVEAAMCSGYVQTLDVSSFLLLGKGEKMNDGRGRDTIHADLFEALLAAIYLDSGIQEVKDFFWFHFQEEVELFLKSPLRNWKAEFQDFCQKKHQRPPVYKVLKELGPDHNKTFEVAAYMEEEEMGIGAGPSKKEAEQQAARDALERLTEDVDG